MTDLDGCVGDSALYEAGQRRSGRLTAAQAAETARDTAGFVWVGLREPTAAELGELAALFGLPHHAVEDAVKAHQRPKLEVYDDVVFAVLKPLTYGGGDDDLVLGSEIALFVGRGFVVTVRHGESDVLRTVRTELDRGARLIDHGPSAVLYRVADLVVDDYEALVEHLNEHIDDVETAVFGDDETDHTQRIYSLKREVAEVRRAMAPLTGPLERLAAGRVEGVDGGLAHSFRDVHDHQVRSSEALEVHDRMLSDVLQANLARVSVRQAEISVRQNEDMRKISAWAAIGLLPTAVAGIYGMNFRHMPELEYRYGYFIVLAVVAAACTGLYVLFRRRGWL